MRKPKLIVLRSFVTALALLIAAATAGRAQQPSSTSDTSGLIAEINAAFAGGQPVSRVELSGSAIWHAGGLEDAGPATLTVTSDGSFSVSLGLADAGARTEAQSGIGLDSSCSWAGSDGAIHPLDLVNCWRPVVWFLPQFSLQTSMVPPVLMLADSGIEPVGSGTTALRHLHAYYRPLASIGIDTSEIVERTASEIGFDQSSLLPLVLSFAVRPDNGAVVSIPIEIHYSDYRSVNGVDLPFHIERYINNSLQLEISISSAIVN